MEKWAMTMDGMGGEIRELISESFPPTASISELVKTLSASLTVGLNDEQNEDSALGRERERFRGSSL